MMRNVLITILCLAGLSASPAAQGATIDFSNYALGTRIDGALSLSGATFMSSSDMLLIDDFGAGRAICAFDGSACTGTLSIGFSDGATGLEFSISGDDAPGSQLGYGGESRRTSFRGRYEVDGDPSSAELVGIKVPNIVKLDLFSNDPGGVAFGDFHFSSSVPEPASWLMMIGGFGLVGGTIRRRRSSRSPAITSR